jgi:hypothetical protein
MKHLTELKFDSNGDEPRRPVSNNKHTDKLLNSAQVILV